MSAIHMEEQIYTAEEARVILNLKNVRTIHRLVKRGELDGFTIGGRYHIRAGALSQYIKNREAKARANVKKISEEGRGERKVA